uniref:Uncharacterized protein n=1 Tax=Chaetoceros debilis TaxID=122233 RepID=A0A7S3PUY0_9STRA|mmetsp:Transcript_11503/g.16769  ORF Transcript_11503/g.16769 Transcript_11503/m.16769 type:complete len:440 (+) Transcript_11503:80-1399(+)|eukprot:CAMPEP_0194085310 /NCGR_PEP_ID=MMETSP0149-20130528/17159_1 /TAXON_ID=122233 /ORGANISM="Chaetoceros debilis, Strain MM31A-1" /LENGTH=439 /DNA_ID=CAMNT_0038768173 /DNA_START=9 /DNA_END=1328 /DNA_ORIENTATION=+
MVFKSMRRKKKNEKEAVMAANASIDTISTQKNSNDASESLSSYSYSSSPRIDGSQFTKELDGSAMAMLRLSSAIAENFAETELTGHRRNSLYRREAKYTSQVIHPVECKRDIFVRSVTPVKKGSRKLKDSSIYKVNVGNKSPYKMSLDLHDVKRSTTSVENSRETTKHDAKEQKAELSSSKDDEQLDKKIEKKPPIENIDKKPIDEIYDLSQLTYSMSEDEGDMKENQINITDEMHEIGATQEYALNSYTRRRVATMLSIDTNSRVEMFSANESQNRLASARRKVRIANERDDNRRIYEKRSSGPPEQPREAVRGSRPSASPQRLGNTLRVETGGMHEALNENNPYGLFTSTADSHLHGVVRYDVNPNPRSIGMEVSPSSTVSSLSMPAELEYYTTPREKFHQQMAKVAPLVAIDENENDHLTTKHDYMSSEDIDISEI